MILNYSIASGLQKVSVATVFHLFLGIQSFATNVTILNQIHLSEKTKYTANEEIAHKLPDFSDTQLSCIATLIKFSASVVSQHEMNDNICQWDNLDFHLSTPAFISINS